MDQQKSTESRVTRSAEEVEDGNVEGQVAGHIRARQQGGALAAGQRSRQAAPTWKISKLLNSISGPPSTFEIMFIALLLQSTPA